MLELEAERREIKIKLITCEIPNMHTPHGRVRVIRHTVENFSFPTSSSSFVVYIIFFFIRTMPLYYATIRSYISLDFCLHTHTHKKKFISL